MKRRKTKIAVDEAEAQKHYGAIFAVLLADSIGYFDPLLARLRDPNVELEPSERRFLADNWGKQRRGGDRRVQKNRKWLRVAACYLESCQGEPRERKKMEAVESAVYECNVSEREVFICLDFAKGVRYGQWRWWDIAARLARKGKIEALHRTY
jgi:hypothetical protein